MFWNLLVASFVIGSACAIHLEYLKVDSDEELLDGSLDSVDLKKDLQIPEEQLPGACWACKWAMGKLKRQLGNNSNQDTIRQAVASVCDAIGFLRFLCRKIINKYMDVLVEELSTTDNPARICANVGIC
ncbi:antimicrobial peptide NK-lysin-like [Clarias gariepinus]|uniref:NK-lysin n=1 Tax=Clarias gariepinus TaxID=13013 RepID=A0A482G8P2_CLAGA|nr:antimicrobial peptide NK-lysin isoform X1 [Clarias gariepinus]XP_053366158.1 antimicrobial peptide NK-lysin isoform X2 [Clarias gariepinus]QBO59841.1 NK-lysin [Clarias gariepinus]